MQDLATSDTEFPRYRIPGLTTSTRGTVVAAFDGRPTMGDVPSDIAMLVRRSTEGGRSWGPQLVVRHDAGPQGYGDPSLITDRQTGRLFLFHAASINQGFAGSHIGNSDTDPDVLQMDCSWSDDDGISWQHRRLTSEAKTPAWGGLFASSGEGIQLREGPYAGRLIQQYVVRFEGENYAASLYSDDHGASWQFGHRVGPGMDENKTVELSDGRVMLNSRAPGGFRKVAYSDDGGVTYSEPQVEHQLVDPANNASIIRLHPDAPATDPRSKMLLFSNTEDPDLRRNLTVKLSCDNGVTWPIRRVVEPESSGYSTMTRLADGDIGLSFERRGYQQISFARFGVDWLNGDCAPLDVQAPEEPIRAGESAGAPPPRPEIHLTAVLDAVYPDGKSGSLGDQIATVLRVTNTGNVPLTNPVVTGNVDHLGDCDLPTLGPGESAVCRTARHVVTTDDLAARVFTPVLMVTGQAPDGTTVSAEARAESVDLTG